MIIVSIYGGMGNQMFQYAAGRSLALARKTQLKLDLGWFAGNRDDGVVRRPYELGHFRIEARTASEDEIIRRRKPFRNRILVELFKRIEWRKKLHRRRVYCFEPAAEFDKDFFRARRDCLLVGFWQSERYFKPHERTIREDFRFKVPLDGENKALAERMAQTNSVSIHARRQDYVNNAENRRLFASCDLEYYRRAVAHVGGQVDSPVFFVFSDDIPWCVANLQTGYPTHYVSHNQGRNSFEDMRLMSLCKHNIIANSSFSWWGAWLNANPGRIVIAPEKWFNDPEVSTEDLIPEGWIRL